MKDEAITLTLYVSPELTDEERDELSAVGAEVIADFTDNFTTEETFHPVERPDEPLRTAGDWVYLQRGLRNHRGVRPSIRPTER